MIKIDFDLITSNTMKIIQQGENAIPSDLVTALAIEVSRQDKVSFARIGNQIKICSLERGWIEGREALDTLIQRLEKVVTDYYEKCHIPVLVRKN